MTGEEKYLKDTTLDYLAHHLQYEAQENQRIKGGLIDILKNSKTLDDDIKQAIKEILKGEEIKYEENPAYKNLSKELKLWSVKITAYFHDDHEPWEKYGEYRKACILTTAEDIRKNWKQLSKKEQKEWLITLKS